MKLDWILGKKLIKLGFELKEEEDFVCLRHGAYTVATFASCAATVKEIKRAAQAWLKEHKTNSGGT